MTCPGGELVANTDFPTRRRGGQGALAVKAVARHTGFVKYCVNTWYANTPRAELLAQAPVGSRTWAGLQLVGDGGVQYDTRPALGAGPPHAPPAWQSRERAREGG